jgi:hypothetical protein
MFKAVMASKTVMELPSGLSVLDRVAGHPEVYIPSVPGLIVPQSVTTRSRFPHSLIFNHSALLPWWTQALEPSAPVRVDGR